MFKEYLRLKRVQLNIKLFCDRLAIVKQRDKTIYQRYYKNYSVHY